MLSIQGTAHTEGVHVINLDILPQCDKDGVWPLSLVTGTKVQNSLGRPVC